MKKIGIMQPYFFPYLGYLGLIKHTDEFILFDTPQYMRHGWIERNRILKQHEGWLYIKVPLASHGRETTINDIHVDNTKDWKKVILSQLQIYKKTSPYYKQVIEVVENVFSNDYDDIAHLNQASLMAVSEYLGFSKNLPLFSEMDLQIEQPGAADEWALNICKALGIKEYWNPPGGESFFDKSKYDKEGVVSRFHSQHLAPYDQKRDTFEPGLSILDVMMFNSPEEINRMLDNYELT